MTTVRLAAISAWLGFALAALFLYPLAVALDSDIIYMQWQPRDTAETIAAVALLTVIFGALTGGLWHRQSRAGSIALAAVAALPIASFLAGLSRQLPFDDALIGAWENPVLRYAIPAAAMAGIAGTFVLWPDVFGRWLRRGLLALSFVSIVVVQTFVAAAAYDAPPVEIDRPTPATAAAADCPSIVALLFDELSFAYLYDGSAVRTDFPALRRLSETATNYLDVRSPADETLVALPAFLAGHPIVRIDTAGVNLIEVGEDGNGMPLEVAGAGSLFATARRLGYRTEMAGYYLPYCSMLGDLIDVCRSLSFYNASSTVAAFSPLNPIQTTLVMWPRQFPFGLLKNPPFARVQRALVEALSAFAQRPLDSARPVFRLVHFSVPHLPFVFDAEGFNPPFNPLRTSPDAAYVRQLRYVDRLAGQTISGMEQAGTFDRTTLVVLADHGFRFGGRDRDPLHIPFIVKRAGQRGRLDVTDARRGEQLLGDIVGGSCGAS
jgi:Sulfatase